MSFPAFFSRLLHLKSSAKRVYRHSIAGLKWKWRYWNPPFNRKSLDVWSIAGGLGDELMALGVLQAVIRKNAGGKITFHTRHIALMPSSSGSLRMVPYALDNLPENGMALTYFPRHQLPVIAQMARQMGLKPTEYPISIPKRPLSELPDSFPKQGITVVVQTVASGWTPNKQWPEEHWKGLIDSLPANVGIVEVGTETVFQEPPQHPHFQSLVGKTTITQFAACIQEAGVFIGPVSSAMHLAHAYQVPSVIVIGGYEAAHPYPMARQFYNPVPCAPCWLRTPCPYDRKCLREITPDQVRKAIQAMLNPA